MSLDSPFPGLDAAALEARLRPYATDPRVRLLEDVLGPDAALHLVGGTVRDALLGAAGADIDLASKLLPDELLRRLEARGVRVVPTGLRHQTVTAVPVDGAPGVEITTFRGAAMRPEGGVSAAETIEEDLERRDFTINALAYALESKRLIAPDSFLDDLAHKRVRAVGDPIERFTEDPLRAMRMVRFASRDGFVLDDATKDAARRFAGALPAIAVERVREELNGILTADQPAFGFSLLLELGFLRHVLPEVAEFDGFEQNEFHPHDLFRHTMEVVEKTRPDLLLRMAALLHDVGKPPSLSIGEHGERHFYRHEEIGAEMAASILERLRYPHAFIQGVVALVRTHMRPLGAGPGGLRRLLRDTGELFPLWRELKEADATSVKINQDELYTELREFDAAIEEVKKGPDVSPLKNLAINGKDLIALGMTPGPRFGEILRALHERVLDQPELNNRETLLEMAAALAQSELSA